MRRRWRMRLATASFPAVKSCLCHPAKRDSRPLSGITSQPAQEGRLSLPLHSTGHCGQPKPMCGGDDGVQHGAIVIVLWHVA